MIAVPGQLTGAGGAADTGEEEVRQGELLDSRCLCREWPGMFFRIIAGPGTGRERAGKSAQWFFLDRSFSPGYFEQGTVDTDCWSCSVQKLKKLEE